MEEGGGWKRGREGRWAGEEEGRRKSHNMQNPPPTYKEITLKSTDSTTHLYSPVDIPRVTPPANLVPNTKNVYTSYSRLIPVLRYASSMTSGNMDLGGEEGERGGRGRGEGRESTHY